MRLIGWPIISWLLFVVLSSLAVGDDPTAQSAPEQLYIVAQTPWVAIQEASHQGDGTSGPRVSVPAHGLVSIAIRSVACSG